MQDLAALLAYPFVAAIIFVGMHTWLGLQVLRRNVVFADLALAQLSALGGTAAVAAGHAPGTLAGFGYALLLTILGAGLLTLTRRMSRHVSQEALIGIVYVVATALTVLVIDRSPQGAEHVKRMLVGSILTIGPDDVFKLVALYGSISLLHWRLRRPLLAAAHDARDESGSGTVLWDFVFYCTFGVVVTSSVALAGVLLVFSFLIIPAVIGFLFSQRMGAALAVGWGAGILASLGGFGASVALDLPTGATMVTAFAGVLLAAAALRVTMFGDSAARRRNRRRAAVVTAAASALAVFAQGAWLTLSPAGDQPLLAVVEAVTGIGPQPFMTASERRTYDDASAMEGRNRAEVERLRALEREARWSGEGLSEDELRRVASFQQTFNEMGRGERFVQDHLRARARERQRWAVGLPAMLLAGLALLWLWRSRRLTGIPRKVKGVQTATADAGA
ncbi:MAG TPA: metal ABC transporter permease [Beijerinckiaceae bacterium]|nr:metal ABC transporter permease [Beijerinckiaceae bacterium]